MTAPGKRRCSICERELETSDFLKKPGVKSGLMRACRSCHRERRARYYLANPEPKREAAKRRYWADPAADKAKHKRWLAKNPKRAREHSLAWYRANPEKSRLSRKAWLLANPDKARESAAAGRARRRARLLEAKGLGITREQWASKLEEFGHRCAYCNEKRPLTIDHFRPFARGGENDVDNIVPACQSCNSRKNDRLIFDWVPLFYGKPRPLRWTQRKRAA
jgi:5-methylcytosine-specific restriction endonuclease McrA